MTGNSCFIPIESDEDLRKLQLRFAQTKQNGNNKIDHNDEDIDDELTSIYHLDDSNNCDKDESYGLTSKDCPVNNTWAVSKYTNEGIKSLEEYL